MVTSSEHVMRRRYLLFSLGLVLTAILASEVAPYLLTNYIGIEPDSARKLAQVRAFAFAPILVMTLASIGYFSLWILSFITNTPRIFHITERLLWVLLVIFAVTLAVIIFGTI